MSSELFFVTIFKDLQERKVMKTPIIALATFLFSIQAHALTICAGETFSGTIVTVTVITAGATGVVQNGLVSIAPSAEPSRTYGLKREEITQFFESTSDDSRRAVVGLAAYVNRENPVSIRYSGANFQDDMVSVLRNPSRVKESGNEMRVWKGPGYPADQQHQFKDVVCQVTLDP